jgi:hypothetical protein
MAVTMKLHAVGLLNYAKEGKTAVQRIKVALRKVANTGRTAARQRIAADFRVRTGTLKKQARAMQTKVDVNTGQIKGRVTPLPNLLNIFEHGATRSNPNRGVVRPRPVVGPAQSVMNISAEQELKKVLDEVGK